MPYGAGNVKVPRCGMNDWIWPADNRGLRPAPVAESTNPPVACDCACARPAPSAGSIARMTADRTKRLILRRISKSTGSLPGSAAPGSRRSAQKKTGLRPQGPGLRPRKSVRRPRSERRDTSTHRGHGNEQIEKESKTAGPVRGNGGATGFQHCDPSKTFEDLHVCNSARRCAPMESSQNRRSKFRFVSGS